MLKKYIPTFVLYVLTIFYVFGMVPTYAATEAIPRNSSIAELFGLSVNNLSLSRLEDHLDNIGLNSYPSYKDGVVSYSLGPEGILGVTNATIFSNTSGYVHQVLLYGVVESDEKRQSLGKLLEKKYGTPTAGNLVDGIGKTHWEFRDGTKIELLNSTFDVAITYIDERPRVRVQSGRIDVEALSRKTD
jgi:hypothetical protein